MIFFIYIFSLSLCAYIIHTIDVDLYYQTCNRPELSASLFWAALRWINVKDVYQHWCGHHNTREKPTGCMRWPLSVCMQAAERMPTPLWKWILRREHASHYHLGVTTSVSSVFMHPGQKSNSCFLLSKLKCCSSLSHVFSPRVQSFPPKKSSQC